MRFWLRFYVTLALAALNFLIRCIALTALYHRCQRRLKKEKFKFSQVAVEQVMRQVLIQEETGSLDRNRMTE